MFHYHIATGTFLHDEEFWGTGYSGAGKHLAEGRNNPLMCHMPQKGPIPLGEYTIGQMRLSASLGRMVYDLTPLPITNVYGRSLFRIHGDNARNDASHGCIILGPFIRERIGPTGDTRLLVSI